MELGIKRCAQGLLVLTAIYGIVCTITGNYEVKVAERNIKPRNDMVSAILKDESLPEEIENAEKARLIREEQREIRCNTYPALYLR